ncbi:MAG: hypothetical protein WCR54_01415 [Clostridia bacterium]
MANNSNSSSTKNNNINNKYKDFITKIKGIKHIEIIIGVIAIAIMLLIFSGNSSLFNSSNTANTNSSKSTNENVSTSGNEGNYLSTEKELALVLSKIEGVGEVEVMINYESTSEKITAKTISNNTTNTVSGTTNSSTTTNTTESPVILNNNGNSQPYILKEITPPIKGVIVVAEGANNAVVKLAIMRACQTILQINANNIEIFTMK